MYKEIIDSVNVIGCEFLDKTRHCKAHWSIMCTDANKCKCFPNCYYKQLQRERQNSQEVRAFVKLRNTLDDIEINILEYQRLTLGKPRTMRENDCIYNILDIINKVKEELHRSIHLGLQNHI